MSATTKRRLGWIALALGAPLAYLLLREYSDRSRSLEAVLGIGRGDPAWNAAVGAGAIVLRVLAYALVGGTLLAWPLEEALLRRRRRAWAAEPTPAPRSAECGMGNGETPGRETGLG